MKKYLIALIFALIIFPFMFQSIKVSASSSDYLRVITDDTPFFTDVNSTAPLFYLPYTYYVKTIGNSGEFTHVEVYGSGQTVALDGFVPTDMLFNDGLYVTNPFVMQSITTATSTVLYQDSSLSTPVQYLFAQRVLQYYGSLTTDDGIIYYVGYNNRLGYVKESDVYPFAIANHPNELTFIKQPEQDEQNPPPQQDENASEQVENFFSLKVIVIACLIFAGVIALVFALKQRTEKPVAVGYYDENDFE